LFQCRATSVSTTAALPYLVAADLNGDGKADVVGISNGTLFVYVSNGDGTFTAGASYNFSSSGALAVGDFNSDGKTDVLISTDGDFLSEGQMIVFLGNGDGTFQSAKVDPGGYTTGSIVVADFNGDGKSDLAMSECGYIAGCVDVAVLGNGDGTFQGGGFFGPTTDPLDGASALGGGDFNGDGKEDLVLVGPNLQAAIYLGNGDGTFSSGSTYSLGSPEQPSFGIAIADFNRDGKPDIAAENIVLLGNGDGTFQSKLK
jgi:FG-GAP-like repeat/FG-GAP repeat